MSDVQSPQKWQTFRTDGQWEGFASIGGMTCAACAIDIETEASKLPGLTEFELNPASGLSRWVASDEFAIVLLQERAKKLGYQFYGTAECAKQGSNKALRLALRQQLLRWAVALLCAIQIMMFAGPEYWYSPQEIGIQEFYLLRWAQWVLALPVILYCARPFYAGAWLAAKNKRWSIDQPIVLGVLLAFAFSSYNLMNEQSHVWFDSVAMLVAFLLLSRWLIDKNTRQVVSKVLQQVPDLPTTVLAFRDGQWLDTPASQLKLGQLFKLTKGVCSPVDARLAPSQEVAWFDEALRTGESDPVKKNKGQLIDAGAKLIGSTAELVVDQIRVGDYLRTLAERQNRVLASKPKRQGRLDSLIPWYAASVLAISLSTTLIWFFFGVPIEQAVALGVTVLLVTCPCALALSWPLVNLFLLERLKNKGVMVTDPDALESLEKVDAIAFDKTGTLAPMQAAKLTWSVSPWASNFEHWSVSLIQEAAFKLAQQSSHPVSRAIVQDLAPTFGDKDTLSCLSAMEVPGMGVSAVIRDRVHDVLFFARLGSARFCDVVEPKTSKSSVYLSVQYASDDLINEGKGILMMSVHIEWGVPKIDRKRFSQLQEIGIESYLLSGDHAEAVNSWAPDYQFVSRVSNMTAQSKAAYIEQLQLKGKTVLMVGDGMNDAIAFSQADVALSGQGSSTMSAQQADLLLTQERLDVLPEVLSLARLAGRLGRENVIWSLSYNAVGIILAVSGRLTPLMAAIGMGLSSVIVLANAWRLRHGKG